MQGLRPSNAGIWSKCPAMGMLNAQVAPIEHDRANADEGVKAHALAERILKGETTYHEETGEMYEHVLSYIESVDTSSGYLGVELKLVWEGLKGAVDAVTVSSDGVLHVHDLKYGRGYVEVVNNPQLVIYAGSLYKKFNHIKKVVLHIFQPRISGYSVHRTHEMSVPELEEQLVILKNAMNQAKSNDPEYNVGGHCRYCAGKHACPALVQAGSEACNLVSHYSHSADLTTNELSMNLEMCENAQRDLKNMIAGLTEALTYELKNGGFSTRYKYEHSVGNSTWLISTEELVELGRQYECSLVTEKPITPRQAVLSGVPKEIVGNLTGRPSRGYKLKRIKRNG